MQDAGTYGTFRRLLAALCFYVQQSRAGYGMAVAVSDLVFVR